MVRIFQGDSTRTFEFDGVVYDPKTTGDIIKLYAALEFYLLEVSLCGVLYRYAEKNQLSLAVDMNRHEIQKTKTKLI